MWLMSTLKNTSALPKPNEMEPTNQTMPNNNNNNDLLINSGEQPVLPSNPADGLLIPEPPKNRLYTYRGAVRYGIPPEERVNGMKWS
jgi:hypothetical protein